jgi:hypothetical protein
MRRQTLVFTGAAAVLLIAACDKAPGIAGPQNEVATQPGFDALVSKTNEQDIPWAIEEENPCNHDIVTTSGSIHVLFGVVANENGGYHLSMRFNSKGTGIGLPSGFTYKVSDEFTYSEQNPEGDQFTIRQEQQVLILGPRQVDNYVRHMVFKVTNNANGAPAADFVQSWTHCVG